MKTAEEEEEEEESYSWTEPAGIEIRPVASLLPFVHANEKKRKGKEKHL